VLIERLPKYVETVYLANPSFSSDEILYAVAEELKIEFSRERAPIALRALQDRLIASYAEGRRTVILIDEAHAMPEETLEEVRLLSNLETSRHKLLQIVLFGQPELDEVLALPDLRQLKDRITHSFRMRPLSQEEVANYLTFRMRAAGYRGPDVFAADAIGRITRASAGLTRRINILADKALLAAFSEGKHAVTAREARVAIADSEFAPTWRPRKPVAAYAAIGAAGLALGLGAAWILWPGGPAQRPSVASAPAVAAPTPSLSEAAGKLLADPNPSKAPAPMSSAGPSATLPGSIPTPATPTPAGATQTAPAAQMLRREQLVRMAGYGAGRNPLLRERLDATRGRLDTEPDGRYSLELYISENSEPDRVERFLARARDRDGVPVEDFLVLPLESGGRYRIWAFYGVYADRSAALEAAKGLPSRYRAVFPLHPRTFAELRRPL
jgi:type II secretory pathway predicted ATPase ExeA